MKKLSTLLLLCMLSLSAHATITVTLDGGNNVTGLQGLDVNGTLYDVVLEYLANPGTDPDDTRDFFVPATLEDHGDASTAAAALAAAISDLTENPTMAAATPPGGGTLETRQNFVIPYLYGTGTAICDGTCVVRVLHLFGGNWIGNDGTVDVGSSVIFAKFLEQPAAVPVPPAVLLFGSGIVALAGLARRRKGGARQIT